MLHPFAMHCWAKSSASCLLGELLKKLATASAVCVMLLTSGDDGH